MAVLFTPRFQAVDANGNPYAGAQLLFYQSGTTTLITTYQDSAVSTPSVVNGAGAVVADTSGTFAPIFINTDPFKFVLKTSGGVTLATADAVPLNDAAAQLTNFQITNSLTVTSTDATAAAGPVINLKRSSASPAAADAIGAVRFTGKDSGGADTIYAEIGATIADPVDGTEDGTLLLKAMIAGVLTTRVTVNAAGVAFTVPLAPASGGTGLSTLGAALQVLRTNAGATAVEWATPSVSNPGGLFGLTLSNNGTDATNDIDVTSGIAADSTNVETMTLLTGLTKRLDAAWAVGTNQGGLDTGSIANTTYHMWLIKRSDTGVVDMLFSASASAPTMPANYDYKRRIGSIVRSSGAIRPFSQSGDTFYWKSGVVDRASAAPGSTAAQTQTLTVPTGVVVDAILDVTLIYQSGGTDLYWLLTPLSANDDAPTVDASTLVAITTGTTVAVGNSAQVHVLTNTSAQIRWRSNTTAGGVSRIFTVGFIDTRGRIG